MSEESDPEIIPFHEAPLERVHNSYRVSKVTLKGGRTVEVGFAANGDRTIIIERPLEDGRRAQLKFGTSLDAAAALTMLLEDSFDLQEFAGAAKANEETESEATAKLPLRAGFYWWRESERQQWRIIAIRDFGDSEHLQAYDISEGMWSGRSVSQWAEHYPIGEWVEIQSPSEPREIICKRCGIREQKGELPKHDF